jgi:hypothetical protein
VSPAAPAERLRVLVLGYVVRGPLGGLAWHHLHYVLGLAALGHDVHFLEDSDDYPSCYDPVDNVTGADPGYGLRFAERAFGRLGLGDRWAYHDAHGTGWHGPCADRVAEICARADCLLNLSGVNPVRPWLEQVPHRAFVDTDPAFTQVRHLTDESSRALAEWHTAFFSFGANVGKPGCGVPDDGLPWQPTRQPVVPAAWPVTPGPADGRFTSVMQWESYPALEYGGTRYGQKSESFMEYADLPRRCDAQFELALGSPGAPRDELEGRGWSLRDPRPPTRDPWTYQRFIRRSKAELGVAKHGYVVSRSGWFSERSAAYLASGRPVLVQDTGFSDWLPTGSGVVCFDTLDEAIGGVAEIGAHYEDHCRAARALAEEEFGYRYVLPPLLEQTMDAGTAPAPAPASAEARP